MQRIINRILRLFRYFYYIYINNIIVFFLSKKEYINYLRQVFEVLDNINITLLSRKLFLNYLLVRLLD